MAHDSIYSLNEKLKKAKAALAVAKKDKEPKSTVASLTKNVKNAEAALKAAERALKESKK